MSETQSTHNRLIVDQFTRMSVPFAEMPEHSDEQAMRLLANAAAVTTADRVLDVCCGTGIVACALAPAADHVAGIDLTPAMIEQARRLQRRLGLANVSWHLGDVARLPFPDFAFSVVVSRYAFHHLPDPGLVLREMKRVCETGARVVVADVFTTGVEQGAAYDHVEKLRDPSHARALPLDEWEAVFRDVGIPVTSKEFYRLPVGLEPLLRASATPPDAADEVRRLLAADVGRDRTGFAPRPVDGAIHISFSVVVLSGKKA